MLSKRLVLVIICDHMLVLHTMHYVCYNTRNGTVSKLASFTVSGSVWTPVVPTLWAAIQSWVAVGYLFICSEHEAILKSKT